jgi:hypothetical protein
MLAIISGTCVGQSKATSQCFAYEPYVIKLKGSLLRKTFPGPPNYEDIHKGDQPETGWYLQLPKAICVAQDKHEPDLNPARKNIKTVQLVISGPLYKKYSSLVGKQVTATGTLFGAVSGHHHTPVLLTVSDLSRFRYNHS